MEKKENKTDYSDMNIYKKLQLARKLLQDEGIQKSGNVAFKSVKFEYFEMEDFMPPVNAIFDDLGMVGLPNVVGATKVEIGSEVTTSADGELTKTTPVFETIPPHVSITIVNTDNPNDRQLKFTREINKFSLSGGGSAQEAEASITFAKRNLWIEVLSLTENDIVNKQEPEYISTDQATQVRKLAKNASVTEARLLKSYELASLDKMLVSDYSNCVNRLNATIENMSNENKNDSNGE